MRTRLRTVFGLAVASSAAVLLSVSLGAQTRPPSGTQLRTPDGRPDLQGVYDVATMTPVARMGNGPLVLTPQEAKALESYETQRQAQTDAPLDPNRGAPPVGGDRSVPKTYQEILERAGGGVVGGYNNFWLAEGTSLITVNGEKRSSILVDPPDGHIPAMKPEARERNRRYLAGAAAPSASEAAAGALPPSAFDNPEARPLAERCLMGFSNTAGPPTLPNYFYNNLKQIVQTPTAVLILNEMIHDARIIRIGGTHLPASVRQWMGDSIGHWEGDTLVVDTTNFTDKTQYEGSSDQLHVVERFTRVNANTLLYRFTVEDPATWDRSFTGEYPWNATNEQIYEYACHEGNHAIENILRGARAAEQRGTP